MHALQIASVRESIQSVFEDCAEKLNDNFSSKYRIFKSFETTYIPAEPVIVGERKEPVKVFDLNGTKIPKNVSVTTEFISLRKVLSNFLK